MMRLRITDETLDASDVPSADRVHRHPSPIVHRSQELLAVLRSRPTLPDVIEYSAGSGIGLRLVQARRTGLIQTRLVAIVPDPMPETELLDPQQAYAEFARYHSYRYADERLGPTAHLAARGWELPPEPSVASVASNPLVTIAITFYNLGAYLPAQVDSLLAQTYRNLEILLVDDGSPRLEDAAIARGQATRDSRIRLIRQPNAGLGAARNRALAEASGELFLPVDADNVSRPEMVETFVRGLTRSPDLDCLTCHSLAFSDDAEIRRGTFRCAYRPSGGPLVMGAIENVLGDANGCFRTVALRAIGGYTTERDTTYEDWETYLRLIQSGRGLEVVPAPLFYYRVRANSMQRTTSTFRNLQRVLHQWAQGESLPPLEEKILQGFLRGIFLPSPDLIDARCRTQELRDRADSLRHRLGDLLARRRSA